MPRRLQKKLTTALIGILLVIILMWLDEGGKSAPIPQDGEPPILYSNQAGVDLQIVYQEAIMRAQKSVLMIIYNLNDQKIIGSLKKQSENGVKVTVICDPEATVNPEKRLGSKVKVVKYPSNGLMHLKIMVIDEKESWIGSANMTGESLRMHGNLVAAIASPALSQAILAKANKMMNLKKDPPIFHQDFIVGGQHLELWFLPDDPHASKRIVDLIRSAKKAIKVAMFTWTRHDLAQEIIDASKRGILTEVAIDRYAGQGAGSKVLQQLARARIPVVLNDDNGLLHYKMLCIDDQILVNGSANWTKAAFTKNDDCFFILHNLNVDQKQVIQDLWQVVQHQGEEVYEPAI